MATSTKWVCGIGELAGVDPDAMSFCFEVLCADRNWNRLHSRSNTARAAINAGPAAIIRRMREKMRACPECGMTRSQFLGGDELELAYLEVENGARELERKVLSENDRIAANLRDRFAEYDILVTESDQLTWIGKTSLLERTLESFDRRERVGSSDRRHSD